jgi:solute carrier family 6 GABA transporter-like protein 1
MPIVVMFIFLGKAVSLDGAQDGISQYIDIWDTSVLKEKGDVRSVAVAHIFFSVALTFGILTALWVALQA